jgi:hypothetical protein
MIGAMYVLDTLDVARASVKELKLTIPDNYQLSTLYSYVTNLPPSPDAHRAEADVTMLLKVLLHDNFWFQRSAFIHKIDNQTGKVTVAGLGRVSEPRIPAPNDDSDTDVSDVDDDDTVVEESPTQEEEETNIEEPVAEEEVYGWHRNKTFEGIDSTKLFNEEFQRRTTRNEDGSTTRVGVQCSTNSVNSPLKAWSQIFTVSILNKLVQYTNDYGSVKCKSWVNITRTDLTDFFVFFSFLRYRNGKTHHRTGGLIMQY